MSRVTKRHGGDTWSMDWYTWGGKGKLNERPPRIDLFPQELVEKLNRMWTINLGVIEWKEVFKGIWAKFLDPKVSVLLWRIAHTGQFGLKVQGCSGGPHMGFVADVVRSGTPYNIHSYFVRRMNPLLLCYLVFLISLVFL
ncbi:hypothetical protein O6H91_11G089200 [Diphasiastrum complanatum]|uniref:Uncharacterized protein n=1 Tax=Diphasiastrum complanatum TaxID=34168 RepID=A0ACC2CBM8_DIPCM|nr:hypothetical protein O6H91_11G089200 [Diphasiastrum complanatum]